jgi:hypothetical protein
MAASIITLPPAVVPAPRQTMPAAPALPPPVIIPDASPVPLASPVAPANEEPGI